MAEQHPQGTWVEVRAVLLEAGERAPQVPEDTACVPLELRCKGYLVTPAAIGEAVEILTVTNRRVAGELLAVNPGYAHGFGVPLPELQHIGSELKALLDESESPP